jgi:hypothetical protein
LTLSIYMHHTLGRQDRPIELIVERGNESSHTIEANAEVHLDGRDSPGNQTPTNAPKSKLLRILSDHFAKEQQRKTNLNTQRGLNGAVTVD